MSERLTPIMDRINERYHNARMYNRGLIPDNVMVHISKKQSLFNEFDTFTHPVSENNLRIFGMRLILTDQIREDEIICTFDQF